MSLNSRQIGLLTILLTAQIVRAADQPISEKATLIQADSLTDDAIAQRRTDDVAAAARLREDRTRARDAIANIRSNGVKENLQPYDVLDGKRNANLFLTYELFDELMLMGFAEDAATRSAYRESKEYHRKSLGLPEDLWQRLEAMSVLYRASRQDENSAPLTARPLSQGSTSNKSNLCRDRFAALSAAEDAFGPRFRRFLYIAVAPDLFQVVLRKPDPARLLAVARGCQ